MHFKKNVENFLWSVKCVFTNEEKLFLIRVVTSQNTTALTVFVVLLRFLTFELNKERWKNIKPAVTSEGNL